MLDKVISSVEINTSFWMDTEKAILSGNKPGTLNFCNLRVPVKSPPAGTIYLGKFRRPRHDFWSNAPGMVTLGIG